MSYRPRILGTIVFTTICCMVLIWIWCWILPHRWCWWCSPTDCEDCCVSEANKDCPPTVEEPQILLDDIHAGVFMHLENHKDWIESPLGNPANALCADAAKRFGDCGTGGTGWDSYEQADGQGEFQYRPGLLFQLGNVLVGGVQIDHFDYVKITHAAGTTYLTDQGQLTSGNQPAIAFDWLDINSDRPCPIDAFHAYSLFQNNNVVNIQCHPDLVDVICQGQTACDPAVHLPSSPDDCLRSRQIHASFLPNFGAITVWPGEDRYWMNATAGDHNHAGYEFNLGDPIVVDHWNDGCFVTRYEGVVSVDIIYIMGSANHNEFHESPMDGGPNRKGP